MLSKVLTIGPITALHYHHDGCCNDEFNVDNVGILFVGIGGMLHWMSNIFTTDSITNSISISEIDSIFGIKSINKEVYNQNNILVYGGKSVHVFQFTTSGNTDVKSKYSFNKLDDLVLDSSIVLNDKNISMIIGYAHNFIDIIILDDDIEDKSNINKFIKRRIQCSEICCLFSMTLNVDDINNIIIASGTVFGKIILWKVHSDNTFDIIHKLSGHEGVVFNIKWNERKNKIATVSDDRSVRVWDTVNGNVLFIGWGHICRPWDSIFITNIDNKELIVTSSEEGTLKVWDINENKCISNLRGHSSDVWRLIYIQDKHMIISGGNDGSIKFWYLLTYLLSCPDDIESTAKRISIPMHDDTQTITSKDSSRRNNGICFLRISDDGNMIVIGFVEGRICTVTNNCEYSYENMIWNDITYLDKQITCGDICFKSKNKMVVLCGHTYGSISVLCVDHNNNKFNCNISNYDGHPLRIINVWFIDTDNIIEKSITFLSASVKGHNKLWNMTVSSNDNTVEIESSKECFTVSKQVATCSIITNYSIQNSKVVVIGDSRGNISIYCFETLSLLQYISKAHGLDQLPISHLTSYNGGFYSLGHDGFLNRYEEISDIVKDSVLYVLASKLSCLPLKTPDQLIVCGNKKNVTIYVCGYLGNVYIVWDVRNSHQLMRIEGGSWKRAHHCIISYMKKFDQLILPRVVFACPIPCGLNTELLVNDSLPPSYDGIIYDKSIGDSLSVPLHDGYPSLGKVGYCTIILNNISQSNKKYILIGGEEGCIKVYYSKDTNDSFIFCEDLVMPFNAAVRALEKLQYNTDYGLVIAAGGRLIYSIWKYLYHSTTAFNNFSLVCCGTILRNASQDHRILSISSYSIENDDENNKFNHFITFGDSRGTVSISKLQDSVLTVINEVNISTNGYPILSSKTSSYNMNSKQFIIGSFGDTTGNISILLLYYSYMKLDKHIPIRLYTYNSHSMGANTLDMILENNIDENTFIFKICSGGDDQSITTCNGTLHFENFNTISLKFSITINSIKVLESASGSALKGIKIQKAFDFIQDYIVISVGYDRRLSIWLLKHDDEEIHDCTVSTIDFDSTIFDNSSSIFPDNIDKYSDKLNITWLISSLVDIGDIGSVDVVTSNDDIYIAVVGEGLQCFKLSGLSNHLKDVDE